MAASARMARPMELRSAGPRAASSMTSGKELVSSSEESRKSEFALWTLAMENMETNLRRFANEVVHSHNDYASTFRMTVGKSMHLEDKDRCALAAEFTANLAQLYHKAAFECQQRVEQLTLTVVSVPKTSAPVPSAYKYKKRTSVMIRDEAQPGYVNTVLAPATGEPVVQQVQQVVIGVSVKTDKPVDVKLEPGTSEPSMACTSIFVGGIPRTMSNAQLRIKFGPKTKIARRYHKKDKMGFARIIVPNEDVDRVLKPDLSVAGHKLRVAKWGSSKGPVHRAPVASTNRRSGDQAMKKQARFVMEFLDAQAARPGDRRLYSQVVAPNTSEARMRSMETTMKQILRRLSERPG